MRRALRLARRAEGRTSPNPIVGCLIVDARGRVLADGFHPRAGEPHAEAVALAKVGGRAPGATLYVTLEPCNHTSARRTRPCAPLVAASGIRRLVYGLRDPFPGHGGGLETVAAAGIEIAGPVLAEECARAVAPFVVYATEKRAHVTLKAAITLDGKIATAAGDAKWITGDAARAHVHGLRDRCDAVLVGAGTVIADDPVLTTRGVRGGRDAVRVIVDGKLRVSPGAAIFRSGSPAPTIVATTRDAPARAARALEAAGAEVWRLPGGGGRVRLRALARKLAERELLSLLVEGGADTHAGFMAEGLCDRLLLYVAPLAVGGARAPSWLGGEGIARLAKAHRFRFEGPPRRLGDDLLIACTKLL